MGVFLFFIFFVVSIEAQTKYWLPIIPSYNLRSDERYTKYLPARVKALSREINDNGLSQAINLIRDDHDLESYLFIISLEKPVKMLAYSRQPQFFDKTAAELQKLIFSSPGLDPKCDASVIFKQLISTAHKGDTYRAYFWRFNNHDPVKIQVAYVSLITVDEQTYVIGAVVFVNNVPDYIILPHRIKTVLAQLKKRGLANAFELIRNDPDELYYFAIKMNYPYRKVANGGNDKLAGCTAEMEQAALFTQGVDKTINMVHTFSELVGQARRGGGYIAYLWHLRLDEPIKIKVSYVMPFTYKKQKLLLGTGYTPLGFPDHLCAELERTVDSTIKLVGEVGLDSAVSVVKKTNTKKLYVFIVDAGFPYRIITHFTSELVGKSADEATEYARKKKNAQVDFRHLYRDMARFAREGGGYYAYEYQAPVADAVRMLKFAYIKSLSVNGKSYFIGATYETLD